MQSPWFLFLDQIGARFEEGQTGFVRFGDERAEVARATQATLLLPLTHTGLLRVEGPDAAAFLHNLMSNDIKQMPLHSAQHNSFNSPKGRMLASFLVWRDQTGYFLQVSADLLAGIYKKLSMYVLRSQVRITDVTPDVAIIGVSGAGAAAALDAAGLVLPPDAMTVSHTQIQVVRVDATRVQIIVPVAQAADVWRRLASKGAEAVGTMAWRWLDIRAGIPQITVATQDEFVAQMVNFELIGGVSFQKGCYPGQEIVARTQYLGKLKKRMFLAHYDNHDVPPAGTDLYAPDFGEQSCGKVLLAAYAPTSGFDLLAVVQISSREAGEVHVGSPDGPLLEFGTLPYNVS